VKGLDNRTLRQEIKFKVFDVDASDFYRWLQVRSPFRKAYPSRHISSIYFDTVNYDFAASNMSGESSRIKLRARWYPEKIENSLLERDNNTKYRIELKRKINNLSDKTILDAFYLNEKDQETKLSSLRHRTTLAFNPSSTNIINPVIKINYSRDYFQAHKSESLRLTVDKNITYQTITGLNKNLLSISYFIVEIKFDPNIRNKVEKILSDFPFRMVRNSKYLACLSQVKNNSY
jgi:SPX domain protein involved in polyphosphate accumulation